MEYSLDDLRSDVLTKASSPERVERVVVYILESKNAITRDNRIIAIR